MDAHIDVLVSEIRDWASQTRSVVEVARRLITHFGVEAEEIAFEAAIARALHWVTATECSVKGDAISRSEPKSVKFSCSEAIAETITPLLILLLEVEPDFTYTAREILGKDSRRILRPYGAFLCSLAEDIARPVWKLYPRLTPKEFDL